jgi:enoyl-CoA hydratase/carnithine racemase
VSVVKIAERGPVILVTINRPENLNAINRQVALNLQPAFAGFDRAPRRIAI